MGKTDRNSVKKYCNIEKNPLNFCVKVSEKRRKMKKILFTKSIEKCLGLIFNRKWSLIRAQGLQCGLTFNCIL